LTLEQKKQSIYNELIQKIQSGELNKATVFDEIKKQMGREWDGV
jgi:hypothetical protein